MPQRARRAKGKVCVLAKKQEAYWFRHDGNARRDQKIMTMRMVYGSEGYGWWWILLELMREATDYKLRINGKYDIQSISQEVGTTPEILTQFFDDCVNEFGLFESDGQYVWSESMLRRMATYNEVCEKRREAINSRWHKD